MQGQRFLLDNKLFLESTNTPTQYWSSVKSPVRGTSSRYSRIRRSWQATPATGNPRAQSRFHGQDKDRVSNICLHRECARSGFPFFLFSIGSCLILLSASYWHSGVLHGRPKCKVRWFFPVKLQSIVRRLCS